jgi:hypothetical protein
MQGISYRTGGFQLFVIGHHERVSSDKYKASRSEMNEYQRLQFPLFSDWENASIYGKPH